MFAQLPFSEDVRAYTFPPLPVTGKHAPSEEQVPFALVVAVAVVVVVGVVVVVLVAV